MREGLREEAGEMVKSILAAVLGSVEMWSRDVIEVRNLLVLYRCPFGARGIRQRLPCVLGFDHQTSRVMVMHILIAFFQ